MPRREDVEDREELQKRDIERVEAFSDGVFAFAVTLMVLAFRIPRPGDPDAGAGLQHLLLAHWPSYVAFALGFTVVGTVWRDSGQGPVPVGRGETGLRVITPEGFG
jgi:uncharacterized membrane protein